jgi:UDP:flavonoid glycosyltransferase YjiC (YdhE family)
MGVGRTILFAWELGGGLAHVRQLAVVAGALAAQGHRPVVACRDLVGPRAALAGLPWPVLPAPFWQAPPPVAGQYPVASFADILAYHGCADADTLAALLRGWDGLFACVRPDLIVAEFAPLVCLAADGVVPVVDVGAGFFQPPRLGPVFPPLSPEAVPRADEEVLLAVVNAVRHSRGKEAATTLPAAVFAGVTRCVAVVPELDPYRHSRGEAVVGPLEPLLPMPPAAPCYFAYLDGRQPTTGRALPVLVATGIAGEGYLPGVDRAGDLRLHAHPPALAEALARCGVVVHHGGVGTAQAALTAGRPQLILPTQHEQFLNGMALHELGVAHCLAGNYPPADAGEALRELLEDPRFAARARAVAARLRKEWPEGALPAIVSACRGHLGSA